MLDSINLTGKTFEDLMALFFCDVNNDDDYYDVISYRLACEHQEQLEGMLHLLTGCRLRGAICGLGLAAGEIGQSRVLEHYLSHSDPIVVSAAIDALRRTGATKWNQISPFLQHESPYVRGAVLRYCKAALGAGAISYLQTALNDPDPIVKENALDELEGIADSSMASLIKNLLTDSSPSVRQAAETLLMAIADAEK